MLRQVRHGAARLLLVPSLLLIDTSLRRRGYQRTFRLLQRSSPSPVRPPRSSTADRALHLARLVNRAASRRDETCLRRALLTWWLLRWTGTATEIRFGVRLEPDGSSAAHAWVERGGQPLTDREDVATLFPLQHGGDLHDEMRGAGA